VPYLTRHAVLSWVLLVVSSLVVWPRESYAAPTHDGFPVYPPERADAFGRQRSFRLESPSRAADLDKVRALRVADAVTITAALDWVETARAYLHTHSRRLGWHEMEEVQHLDGGSRSLVFGRQSGRQVQLVTVALRAGAVVQRAGAAPSVPDDWGTIEYRFERLPAPPLLQGFPLCSAVSGRPVGSLTTTPYGQVVERTCAAPGPGRLWRLPELFGWTVLDGGVDENYLYGRRGSVVHVETVTASETAVGGMPRYGLRYTFMSSTRARQLREELRVPLARTVLVDAGAFVHDGRLVPRPYRLEIQGGTTITVNGRVLRDLRGYSRRHVLGEFDREVARFQGHGVTVSTDQSVVASWPSSPTAVSALNAAVSSVVTSAASDEQKLKRLLAIPELRRLDRAVLKQIIRSWGGSRPGAPSQGPP
jgi:hypothetical protein